jgi:hypothetical protein
VSGASFAKAQTATDPRRRNWTPAWIWLISCAAPALARKAVGGGGQCDIEVAGAMVVVGLLCVRWVLARPDDAEAKTEHEAARGALSAAARGLLKYTIVDRHAFHEPVPVPCRAYCGGPDLEELSRHLADFDLLLSGDGGTHVPGGRTPTGAVFETAADADALMAGESRRVHHTEVKQARKGTSWFPGYPSTNILYKLIHRTRHLEVDAGDPEGGENEHVGELPPAERHVPVAVGVH